MTKEIKTVTVVGAGVMGMGIAAQLANAGIRVHLLEMKTETAVKAIDRMKNAKPTDGMNAGFMSADSIKRVIPGSSSENFEEAVKDSDWVIEVIPEKLEWKRDLYKKIDAVRRPGTLVSSNTSSIPLKDLTEGFPDDFRKNFAITHFFNPPRHQHLLELVTGPDTASETHETLRDICDVKLGKYVLECNDTPLFVANRIGVYSSFRVIAQAMKQGLTVEEVDAVYSRPLHMDKNGVFGMFDVVGLNLMPNLIHEMKQRLPKDDPFFAIDGEETIKFVDNMIKKGLVGRATPAGGFYRPKKDKNGQTVKDAKDKTVLQAIDLKTGDYHDAQTIRTSALKTAIDRGLRPFLEKDDKLSRFAWETLRDTLLYTISLVPEVSDDITDFDAGMRQGYLWDKGPFELIDEMGVEWFTNRVRHDGIKVPALLELANGQNFYKNIHGKPHHLTFDFKSESTEYKPNKRPPGVLRLEDVKIAAHNQPVFGNDSASVWDIGDGVLCFEFHSKQNSIDPSILYLLNKTIKLIELDKKALKPEDKKFKALVIHNDAQNFSVGANIGIVSGGLAAAHDIENYTRNPKAGTIANVFGAMSSAVARQMHASKHIEKNVLTFVDDMVHYGQSVYKALRESSFPVVGAPQGMALGGGCEILLFCDRVQASAETYAGLVESGVGVIPGWGGCARMLEHFQLAASPEGIVSNTQKVFQNIMKPPVSSSARDAQKNSWFRPQDGISMNKDRVLADAKAQALTLVPGYQPPQPVAIHLPGRNVKHTLEMGVANSYLAGDATWHDVVVADALANVLTAPDTVAGKIVTEEEIRHREREAFMSLVKTSQTQARIAFMISNNKPLRENPPNLEGKTLDEIRAMRQPLSLPRRPFPDGPLTGADEERLYRMAQDAEEAMRITKDKFNEVKRNPGRVLNLAYRFILK